MQAGVSLCLPCEISKDLVGVYYLHSEHVCKHLFWLCLKTLNLFFFFLLGFFPPLIRLNRQRPLNLDPFLVWQSLSLRHPSNFHPKLTHKQSAKHLTAIDIQLLTGNTLTWVFVKSLFKYAA